MKKKEECQEGSFREKPRNIHIRLMAMESRFPFLTNPAFSSIIKPSFPSHTDAWEAEGWMQWNESHTSSVKRVHFTSSYSHSHINWRVTAHPLIFISPPGKRPGRWEMLTEITFPDDEIVGGERREAHAFCRAVYWWNTLRLCSWRCVRGGNSPGGRLTD